MDGTLKLLIGAACIVVIAAGCLFVWKETTAENIPAAKEMVADPAQNADYEKCRNSLNSSALGEAKALRDWCRQAGLITYDEQLRAEGVKN